MPPRRAQWRRTLAEPARWYLADESDAIPEEEVDVADMDEMFPRHAELFHPVVAKVLNAAASGIMNDHQAHASEQVNALRLLMQCSLEKCSWAADAVNYLLEAGCFGDTYRCSDSTVLPNVVDELKKVEVNRELVRWFLTRTDIDQVLSEHGLPGSPPKTTIREHLHLTAPDDCMHFYGVEAPVKYDIEGRPILPSDLTNFERAMCVVPQGRGDPRDAGKAIGPQETAAQRLNETLPFLTTPSASGRPVGSSSASSAEKRQKGDPAM